MKNRERLLKTNEYDLLLRIQRYMDSWGDGEMCVLEPIMMKNVLNNCNKCCSKCIQKWLNDEEESNGNLYRQSS